MPDVGFYKGQAPTTQNQGTEAVVSDDGTTTIGKNLFNCTIVGILVPPGLSSTAITFQTSQDNIDYFDVKNPDDSSLYTIVIDSSGGDYVVDATRFAGRPWIKLEFNASETPGTIVTMVPWLV